VTEKVYIYARKQITDETKLIDISLLKLQVKRKQNSIKLLELNMAFRNGENNQKGAINASTN
jgi:hypothetical protein